MSSPTMMAFAVIFLALFSLMALYLWVVFLISYCRDISSNVPVKERRHNKKKTALKLQKVESQNELQSTDSSSTDDSQSPPGMIKIEDPENVKEFVSVLAGDSCFPSYDDDSDDEEAYARQSFPRTYEKCTKLILDHRLELDDISLGRQMPRNLHLTVSGKLHEDEESSIVQNMKAAQAGLRGESSAHAAEV